MKRDKPIYCNNENCQDRRLCKFGGKRTWNCKIIYGQGMNHNECDNFQPKSIEQAGFIENGNDDDTK